MDNAKSKNVLAISFKVDLTERGKKFRRLKSLKQKSLYLKICNL